MSQTGMVQTENDILGWIETYHRLPQRTWRWDSKLGLPELLEVGPFSQVEFQSFDRALPEVSLKIDVFFCEASMALGSSQPQAEIFRSLLEAFAEGRPWPPGVPIVDRWVKEVVAFIEERLEVKLPTIWTVEKQRWEESEKRKSRKKEDSGARKGRKVAEHCVFLMI